ncbi:MAG: hypothetical protein AAGC46_05580 [Solirubrobacteraceae bacterium]|nr:hypothetical protein [Patulibacter sp.]
MTRPHRRSVPRSAAPARSLRGVAAALVSGAVALGAAAWVAAPAQAAPTPLTASVVGESPQGGGVFRFPQAVAVTAGGNRIFVGDQYSSVVQAFDGAGHFLFTVGSRATRGEPGRFGVVGGVAVDKSNHLYVVDAENDRIETFDASDGHFISTFGDPSMFNLMGGSAADGAGITAGGIAVFQPAFGAPPAVFIADEGNDRVVRLQLDPGSLQPIGTPVISPPSLGLEAPQGLAVDATGQRLYIADDDHHRVVATTTDTLAYLGQGGGGGTGPGQLQNPYDVAVDSSSPPRIYVADNLNGRVQVFDAGSLAFLATFGSMAYGPGVGNLEIVRAVGSLPDAPGVGISVADTANNRIQTFDPSGNVTAAFGIAGRGPGYSTRPRGVTFAPDGGVTVADTFDQRVTTYSPDGTFTGVRGLVSQGIGFAIPGSAPGQFEMPVDVAYDGAGDLWVSDSDNDRVVIEGPDGSVFAVTRPGDLKSPRGLAPSSSGVGFFVADEGDDSVALVSPNGTVTQLKTGLQNPVAVASDPVGGTWVADDHAITNIQTGRKLPSPEGGRWDHPAGIAFDGSGTIYVAERRPGTPNGARIVRGTQDGSGGETWDQIAGEGDGVGQVIEPGGISVNLSGTTLLVADTGNNRVQRFDAPGVTPPTTHNLTVAINDMHRGTVTSDLAGIACVTDCQQHYGGGRVVTLTAQPKSGFKLAGWTGDCAAAQALATCSIPMTADRSVGATFVPTVSSAPSAPAAPTLKITSLTIKPSTLHASRTASKRLHRTARKATKSRVRVALTTAAPLTVRVLIGKPGRKQGSQCKPVTRKNKASKRTCTRYVALAGHRSLAKAARVGFTFTTLWNRRQLAAGRYELSVSALAPSGVRIAPTIRHFTVTR